MQTAREFPEKSMQFEYNKKISFKCECVHYGPLILVQLVKQISSQRSRCILPTDSLCCWLSLNGFRLKFLWALLIGVLAMDGPFYIHLHVCCYCILCSDFLHIFQEKSLHTTATYRVKFMIIQCTQSHGTYCTKSTVNILICIRSGFKFV